MTGPTVLENRYELIERIGGGGMGQVWRARDRVLERTVAVKTVDLSAQDQSMKERFHREAIATAGLSAPNIVQVYDAGFEGKTAFLVMELLTGPSLAQMLHDQGRLPLPEVLRIAREVTQGLIAAHRIGVVHRDIKPGNVMAHHDQIKLVDFGIAQLARDMGATLTAPSTALGTAAYMSPEQASGRGATERSDWYSLGCLLTAMLTGKPPFEGDAIAVAGAQINQPPPRVSASRPDTPRALTDLVDLLLAKDPARRPDGEQILRQLRALEVDPNAPTQLLAAGAPDPATRVMATRSFGEQPGDQRYDDEDEPVRPVAPYRPRHAASRYEQEKKTKPWPIVLAVLLLLFGGLAAAFSLFGGSGGETAASPSPSATRTTQRPTPTAPTTTRDRILPIPPWDRTPDPTSTRTTKQPTKSPTKAPTSNDPGTPDPRVSQLQNSPEVASAIGGVADPLAKARLSVAWAESVATGDTTPFLDTVDQLRDGGSLTGAEAKGLRQVVRKLG